ncbi:MAG: hypothetical protein OSB38_18640 [Paraburkholderia fungorum]|nr:hypothetical protein [Paraburkholderia fungorum]
MGSFHRGDWLSLTQTIASILAICGAFGVVFLQNWLQHRRDQEKERTEAHRLISMAASFAIDAYSVVDSIERLKSDPLMTETSADRQRDRRRLAQTLEALNGIPIAGIATVNAARLLIDARNQLTKAIILASQEPGSANGNTPCNDQYGAPYRPMRDALDVTTESLKAEAEHFE